MKLFCAIIIVINTASPLLGEAVFSFFEKTTYKFEDTKQGEQLSHVFKFKNTGDSPLVIDTYQVACTCTKAKFSKEPILPGQESQIEITFDTQGKFGYQDRIIEIFSNSKKSVKLRIKVYVYNLD
jgi:hypothetical protein